MSDLLDDLPTFLAHALTLERESAERYRDLAVNLAAHHAHEVCTLFEKMAHYGDLHAAEVESHAEGITLPRLAPWDFDWGGPEGPETQPFDAIGYGLTPRGALEQALVGERGGHEFYDRVARQARDPAVRDLAREFADEEAEHVRLLEEWIARTPLEPESEDPDPPNAVA